MVFTIGDPAALQDFGAVLDANVLIKAGPRDTLLRAADALLYQPLWTMTILDEVQRNLVAAKLTTADGAQRLVDRLREVFPDALVTGYEALIPTMTNHPKDRHVLAAAVAGEAAVIVTENLRDFPPVALRDHRLVAVSIDGFLLHLFTKAPATMRDILAQQGRALRRPRTIAEVLASLHPHAPRFVEAVRGG